jgi:hypothetical protein
MTLYTPPLVSIAILDYNRPKEAARLLESIREHAQFTCEVVYVSNGGDQSHVQPWYDSGLITRWVRDRFNAGCGLGTRLAIQACMTTWVMYVQVDQFLSRGVTNEDVGAMFEALAARPNSLYVDLAGNQGQGRFSERALLIRRDRYLSIPGMSECIGGPGPWADHKWTEQLVQEHMAAAGLGFVSLGGPPLFADNGKWSRRTYPCGAETLHSTDEKRLFILKPFKQRLHGFPNLKLNEDEWALALGGKWPKEGRIPEADKPHSFLHWRDRDE